MKEAKKKIQKDFGVTAGLLVLSILYTVAIMFIDVRPIGPQGSVVGFATVNQYFHTLFGTNMLLYNITDLLSIPILFVMLGFAIVGLALSFLPLMRSIMLKYIPLLFPTSPRCFPATEISWQGNPKHQMSA